MRVIHFIVLIISGVLLLSCEKDNGLIVNSPFQVANFNDKIIPFAVGNQWTYVDSTNGVSPYTTVLGIIGVTDTIYQGRPYKAYHWNWLNGPNFQPSDITWYMANGPDGVLNFGGICSSGSFMVAKSLYVKYPVQAGETWNRLDIYFQFSGSFAVMDTTLMTVVSTDEILVTPAGTFHCIVYSSQFYTTTYRDYYALNIGWVGRVAKSPSGIVSYKKLLKSFQLN